jgi:hypothetical protein
MTREVRPRNFSEHATEDNGHEHTYIFTGGASRAFLGANCWTAPHCDSSALAFYAHAYTLERETVRLETDPS